MLPDVDIEHVRVRGERHNRLGFDLSSDLLETVPPHRIARLRRRGSATSPTGCTTFLVIAVSPARRSALARRRSRRWRDPMG